VKGLFILNDAHFYAESSEFCGVFGYSTSL
jgi:hypothetical protein